MKRINEKTRTICIACALVLTTLTGPGTASGGSAREIQTATDVIKRKIATYAAALNAAHTGIASQVWLMSPEVSLISPAGHQHGWEEVKKFYEFFGASFSERNLMVHDMSVHVYGNTAWAEFYWHFDGKQRSDGALVQTDGRETQVYRRLDRNRWALVHVHYSGMPMIP